MKALIFGLLRYLFAIFSSLKISVEETSCKEKPNSLKDAKNKEPGERRTTCTDKGRPSCSKVR